MKHMKYKSILPLAALAFLMATACDDSKMEWAERNPATEITAAEIPLSLAAKIAKYDLRQPVPHPSWGRGVGWPGERKRGRTGGLWTARFAELVLGKTL